MDDLVTPVPRVEDFSLEADYDGNIRVECPQHPMVDDEMLASTIGEAQRKAAEHIARVHA